MYEGAKQRSVIVGEDGEERVDEREGRRREGGSYVAEKKGAERWWKRQDVLEEDEVEKYGSEGRRRVEV